MYDKILSYLNKHIIGQEKIKQEITRFIIACKKGENFNFLLVGPSGYGKTHLARVLYNILGVENTIEYNPENVIIDDSFKIQYIDEVHIVKTPEYLYPFMDKNQYIFLLGTNLPGLLKEPLKNRCIVIYLDNYTDNELGQIIKNHLKGRIPDNFANILGSVSRGNPRIAKLVGTRYRLIVQEKGTPRDENELEQLLNDLYINREGYTDMDNVYLNFLQKVGRASLKTISSATRLDESIILNDIEPFLINKGSIQITSRGRTYVKDHFIP